MDQIVTSRVRRRPGGPTRRKLLILVLATVLVVALPLAGRLLGGAGTIGRLRITNPTRYNIDVAVSGDRGKSWTLLTTVPYAADDVVEEVRDQGPVWTFRFQSQGKHGGQLTITHTKLRSAGWTMSIPPEVGVRLMRAGAPLPPPRG